MTTENLFQMSNKQAISPINSSLKTEIIYLSAVPLIDKHTMTGMYIGFLS